MKHLDDEIRLSITLTREQLERVEALTVKIHGSEKERLALVRQAIMLGLMVVEKMHDDAIDKIMNRN